MAMRPRIKATKTIGSAMERFSAAMSGTGSERGAIGLVSGRVVDTWRTSNRSTDATGGRARRAFASRTTLIGAGAAGRLRVAVGSCVGGSVGSCGGAAVGLCGDTAVELGGRTAVELGHRTPVGLAGGWAVGLDGGWAVGLDGGWAVGLVGR